MQGLLTFIKVTVEVVLFLFAAFGGFLTNVAPPDDAGGHFAHGLASFSCLIVLLLVSAISKGRIKRRYWIIAASIFLISFIGTGLFYKRVFGELTFPFPPETSQNQKLYVGAGTDYTDEARKALAKDPTLTASELVDGLGGVDFKARVWPQRSLYNASLKLTIYYLLMVLSLASVIFCLTEGVLSKTPEQNLGT
jgi:hypothetical protein